MKFRPQVRGFTLVEILVVVVIVAVVTSIAVLSIGLAGDDRELQTEARRFTALMQLAQDEAVLQGREFGLEVMQGGYRFVEFDPFASQWGELVGEDVFRQRRLPDGAEFELLLEGQRITLDPDPARIDAPDDDRQRRVVESYEPHVYIFSSGDTTPFELRILRHPADVAVTMRRQPGGAVEIVADDAGA